LTRFTCSPVVALLTLAALVSVLPAGAQAPPNASAPVRALLSQAAQARASKNQKGEAAALNRVGEIYETAGQSAKALGLYQQALLLARAAGDTLREANILSNIGEVYSYGG